MKEIGGDCPLRRLCVIVIVLSLTCPMGALMIGGSEDSGDFQISSVNYQYPAPNNNRARQVTELEDVWYPENNGLGTFLVGTGQIIGLVGGPVDEKHPDLIGRVTRYGSAIDDIGFGTHLAGTLIGNGFCYETTEGLPTGDSYYNGFAGVCPEGLLIVSDTLGTSDWNAMVLDGARVIANPWGGQSTSGYGLESGTADTLQWGNPTTVVIFPTGQSGPRYRTLNDAGNSWCGLSVGGSENDRPDKGSLSDDANTLYEPGSRGPMTDGRIKPDIVAPSTNVVSTKSTDVWEDAYLDIPGYNIYNAAPSSDYMLLTSTSPGMAHTTSSAALVRQYLIDIEGYLDPNRVLVKALLLNGAEDMGYGYPSYEAGWGRLNLKNSIVPDAPRINQWAESAGLLTGQTWDFATDGGANTYIESDRVPLKVMLCWDMPAGATMSNDYELEVTSPSGVVYKGNCFDQSGPNDDWSHPDPDAAFWNTLGSPTAAPPYGFDYDTDGDNDDDINNVEAVFVEKPEIGTWAVTIRSDSTPDTPRFTVAWGADTGPVKNYHVELTTGFSTMMGSDQGGTLVFPFEILNFGTQWDNISFSDDSDADITVTYSEASPLSLASNESKDILTQITVSPAAAVGTHEFTITGLSLDDPGTPPSQDKITVKVDVIGTGLPITYQVTTNNMSQAGPSVVAFTNATDVDNVIIAYASEEGKVNGNRVWVSHTTDDLTTGPGTWTHTQVSTQPDTPTDIRITHMPGGTYQDRVFISWRGWDPTSTWDYFAYCAWADPPYTTWNPMKVFDNIDNPAYDDAWRATVVCCRQTTDEVMMIVESLEYSGGVLSDIDTFAKISTDGGATWGAATQISPADGNYYFYPNAFTDKLDNIVVYLYRRLGIDRDIYHRYYDGTWNVGGVVEDTSDNCMHPAGTATSEGAANNRWYCFFTRSTTTTSTKQGWIACSDDLGSTWSVLRGPIGNEVSDVDFADRAILDIDATEEGATTYVWPQYIEKVTPFDSYNIDNAVSDDFFVSWEYEHITRDSHSKGHQVGDSLGEWMYETYHSYSNDLETGSMDVWLKVYHYGWETDPDIWGPLTSMAAGTPNPCAQGSILRITANIDDTKSGNSSIAAAEWCEGAAPSWPGTPMSAYDGTFDSPTDAVIATTNTAGWAVGEHTIWVRGYDGANWGEAASGTVTIFMQSNSPPVVTVTHPTAADIIESGTFDIAWDATDAETADEDLVIDIYYSDDGGSTWTPIASGLFNTPAGSGTYSWDTTTLADGVNYLIHVNATDDGIPVMIDSDYSDNPFSIDNVVNDRWYFQASAPIALSMYPVELTPNTLSTPIDSAGHKPIGAWSSQVFAGGTSITGQWDFSAWGYTTTAGCEGYLCARIYSSTDYPGPGYQWETSNCLTDVGTVFAWTEFTWSDAGVTGNIVPGDSIIVELLVEAVSGAATTYIYDVANGESGTAPSSGDYTDTWTSNNVYEEITENAGGGDIIWADGFESGDFSAWNLVEADWEVNQIGTNSIGGYLILWVPEGSWIATGSDSNGVDNYFGKTGVDMSGYSNRQVTYSYCVGNMEVGEFGLVDLWYDGAWINYAQYSLTTLIGDPAIPDEPDDWIRNTIDLETQGISDWTDVGIRFGVNAAAEVTDVFHIDWVEFDGTVPSWMEHTWTVPVTGGIDVEVGVEAHHTANGEGDDFYFYYSTTGAGAIDTWTPMFSVSKTADDDVAQTYSDAILDVFSGTLYIGVLDADRTPGNAAADTLYIDYLYVQSETTGPNFVFGYDYGATQSYVEFTPPPLTYDIDLAGVAAPGWVLVSFLIDASGHPESVVNDTSWGDGMTDWDVMMSYDNVNKIWLTYSKYKPPSLNTLLYIDNTMGLWIHITANGDDQLLTIGSGNVPAGPVFIDLYTGWNLVGYPSATPRAGDVTLPAEANLVSVYDLGQAYRIRDELKSAVTFTEGNAHWVRVAADCVWQVDP